MKRDNESAMIEMKRIVDLVVIELQEWARWMRRDTAARHLGYPSRSAGMQSGYISKTFDEMCESGDMERVLIINSLIDDMGDALSDTYNSAQVAALHHCYLGLVARFPRNNYPELLAQAHMDIFSGMKRKGLYIL